MAIFESGAFLTYLAEKSGQRLVASEPARYRALECLHWSIGGLGPMLGQQMSSPNGPKRKRRSPSPASPKKLTA
ncbi:MAG: hypothetical protein H7274_14810 [Rhodoferax sp.]|nr:hypothetical protein [Rhodoferax sp.]